MSQSTIAIVVVAVAGFMLLIAGSTVAVTEVYKRRDERERYTKPRELDVFHRVEMEDDNDDVLLMPTRPWNKKEHAVLRRVNPSYIPLRAEEVTTV